MYIFLAYNEKELYKNETDIYFRRNFHVVPQYDITDNRNYLIYINAFCLFFHLQKQHLQTVNPHSMVPWQKMAIKKLLLF